MGSARFLLRANKAEETTMKITTIVLAAAFALTGTLAVAQTAGGTAGGSSQAGGPAASKTTTGAGMSGSTTGKAMAMHRGRHHHKMHRRHPRM
jgi:uncharacterized membrane protein